MWYQIHTILTRVLRPKRGNIVTISLRALVCAPPGAWTGASAEVISRELTLGLIQKIAYLLRLEVRDGRFALSSFVILNRTEDPEVFR